MDYDDPSVRVKRTRGDGDHYHEETGHRGRVGVTGEGGNAFGGWVMTDQTGSEDKDKYDDENDEEMRTMARNEEKLENVKTKMKKIEEQIHEKMRALTKMMKAQKDEGQTNADQMKEEMDMVDELWFRWTVETDVRNKVETSMKDQARRMRTTMDLKYAEGKADEAEKERWIVEINGTKVARVNEEEISSMRMKPELVRQLQTICKEYEGKTVMGEAMTGFIHEEDPEEAQQWLGEKQYTELYTKAKDEKNNRETYGRY